MNSSDNVDSDVEPKKNSKVISLGDNISYIVNYLISK